MCPLQHRAIRFAEQADIGDCQRTDGFTVIAALDADKFLLVGLPAVTPRMKTHLQRNFDRRCAIGGVKAMTELVAGQCG
jgi:hypothetical protein